MKLKEKIEYLKSVKEDQELNKIVEKLPDNKTICQEILKIIKNEKVQIEESKVENSQTSLYLVFSNTIQIGRGNENFTRIQTIAHECIHSIQNRKKLLFHFCFSNIYLICFVIAFILMFILKNVWVKMSLVIIFLFASFLLFLVRYSLEKDAMNRAEELAQIYLRNKEELTKKEEQRIEKEYEKINQVGIPMYKIYLMGSIGWKVILLVTIQFIT